MRTRNSVDPTTKGEVLEGKFRYHVLATTGEPLVHIARSRVPEIVIFGHEQRLKQPKMLRAGKRILITPLENGDLRAGRYDPGQETVYETFPPELDKLIRTVAKLGGGYTEVIQCLQEAKQSGCLEARMAVEAMPRPNRTYYRDDDPLPEAPESEPSGEITEQTAGLSKARAATPSSELFASGPTDNRSPEDEDRSRRSELSGSYVAPEYAPKKPGFLDTLNPFDGK
jgi:hypothetical protein